MTRFLILLILLSCGKRKEEKVDCVLVILPFSQELADLDFKKGSKWEYIDPSTTATATMQIAFDSPMSSISNSKNVYTKNDPCYSYNRQSYKEVNMEHSFFKSLNTLFFALRGTVISFTGVQTLDDPFIIGLPNSDDTVRLNQNQMIFKSYRVKVHNNYNIQGKIYPKVTEMYYSPSHAGFSRLWWCEKIGFVNLEYNDSLGNKHYWELKESTVILN